MEKDNNDLDCTIDNASKIIKIPLNENIIKDLNANKIKYIVDNDMIIVKGTNFIDFLGKTGNADIGKLIGENVVDINVWKVDDDAIIPSKENFSDVGYDLSIIKKHKDLTSNCAMYDTGIKVNVPCGYYIEIVPRSSLSKSGWIMANGIGIIDASYTGNLYVALAKNAPDASDLELPFKGFQMIVRKQQYGRILVQENIATLSDTVRGDGGFGSTS